jgi:SAM-dependent methyltransferase
MQSPQPSDSTHPLAAPGSPAAAGGPHSALDWAARYASADTPWDLGAAHPELVRALAQDPRLAAPKQGYSLVAGAGRGHDALALARAGHRVLAIDLVDALAAQLAPALERLGGRFWAGDALSDALWARAADPADMPAGSSPGCAFIFEHTFLCALDPSQRPAWGQRMRQLLQPGGRLAALVFPVDKPLEQGGPPHRLEVPHIAGLLGPEFALELDRPVETPGAGRQWVERWAVFVRR